MALATLLLPPALLVVAAALSWVAGLARLPAGRQVVATAAWLALAALAGAWLAAGRGSSEFAPGMTAGVTPVRLRVDAVIVLFQMAVLLPAALLLTFQRRSSSEATRAALATAAALGCLDGGSLLWTAIGLGVCTSVLLIHLYREEPRVSTQFWVVQTVAWLLLVWTAVLLESAGGTSVYGAIPVTALRLPAFAVMTVAALLCSGLLPWRSWVSEAWTRGRLEAGTLAIALIVPLGLYPLVRAYGMGAGQWPGIQTNVVVAAVGTAVALGAAVRAQAAATRRRYLAEAVPLASGLALLALGLGTPLGLVAALTATLALSTVAGLAPLVPPGRGAVAIVAIAVAAGAPPAVVFAGWLLTIQAAVEAGIITAFLGLAGAAAWLLGLAAAARAIWLPDTSSGDAPGAGRRYVGSLVASAAAITAGVAVTAVVGLLAIPAAAEVMPTSAVHPQSGGVSQAAILGAGSIGVSTASGGWSAVLLAGPLVLIALITVTAAHLARRRTARISVLEEVPASNVAPPQPPPEPFFAPPLATIPHDAARRLRALRLPEQYRSLFRPALMERAAVRGGPWLWAAATVALTIAVTR